MKIEPDRLREVFAKALGFKSADERENYLAAACEGDPELRLEVESLLQAYRQSGDFFNQTVELSPTDLDSARLGMMIGRYKLLEKIGEGGFGVVYMAEQQEPMQRKVALKIIKPGMDTREVIARFEAERQALALMDHPNIARVLDGGTTDAGRPFFVMELVRGLAITDYCDQSNLSTTARLSLFIKVCQAVQHAHQKAVIHRDLKPSNILVTLHDGQPVPKVIDFGVAKALGQKLTEKTLFTAFRQMVGTPAYMSPEQTEMSGLDIDTRSDIYSLGVLLYELLIGVTPFDREVFAKAGLEEIRRLIRETEPPIPSRRLQTLGNKINDVAQHRHTEPGALSRFVCGDLDWVVMKCLEKDRARRYATANGLAMDLERFLSNEPVSAGAPGPLYRAQKFVRRHKAALATACALAGLLAAGVVVSGWQALRATRNAAEARRQAGLAAALAQEELTQRQRSEMLTEQSQMNLYCADIHLALLALEEGNLGQARTLLDAHIPRPGQKDPRGFEWHYLKKLCQGDNTAVFRGHSNLVSAVAFSPDGGRLASGSRDESVKLWEVDSGRCVQTFLVGDAPYCVAFSSDGHYLASGGEQGVIVWDLATQERVFSLREKACRVAFSPMAPLLAIGIGGGPWGEGGWARIVEIPDGREVTSFPDSGGRVAFSESGKLLATGQYHGAIKLWDIATRRVTGTIENAGEVQTFCLSPDGQLVAGATGWNGEVTLWNIMTGRVETILRGHTVRVWGLAFSPDGRQLATASGDQSVRLWSVSSGQELDSYRGHGDEIHALAFSSDGKIVATGSRDETVMLWSVLPKIEAPTIASVSSKPVFSRNSELMAAAAQNGVTVWALPSMRPIASLPGESFPLGFSPDHKTLITAVFSVPPIRGRPSKMFALKFWDVAAQTNRHVVQLAEPLDRVSWACLSPDQQTLAAGSYTGQFVLWDTRSGQSTLNLNANSGEVGEIGFSPDGTILASAGPGNRAYAWSLPSGKRIASLDFHKDTVWSAVVSPDSQTLATASLDGTIGLWDLAGARLVGTLKHKISVFCLVFSPDGKTLAAGEALGVKLWNPAAQRELFTLKHDHAVIAVAFSPDGKYLASVTDQHTLHLWRTTVMTELDTGKVSHWQAEGTARDGFGDNHGELRGGVGFGQGKVGQAFTFDGATGYIEVPDSPSLDLRSQGTVMAWILLDELPSTVGRIMSIASKPQSNNDLDLQVEMDDRVRFYVGPGVHADSTTVLRTGIWYHVAAAYKAGDKIELLINGVQEGTERIHTGRDANTNSLILGWNSVWPDRFLHGRIDEVRVYDKMLDEQTVKDIFVAEPFFSSDLQKLVMPRDPKAGPCQIDLSPFFNAVLTNTWHSGEQENSLGSFPRGLQAFVGVDFDARGILQLKGLKFDSGQFPRSINGIGINHGCNRMHFLQATQWHVPDGTRIGDYIVHYADHTSLEVPLVYGENIRDWWAHGKEAPLSGDLEVVWSGVNKDSKLRGQSIRMFKWTWKNPRPQTAIASLDFESAMTECSPFLIAITVEP